MKEDRPWVDNRPLRHFRDDNSQIIIDSNVFCGKDTAKKYINFCTGKWVKSVNNGIDLKVFVLYVFRCTMIGKKSLCFFIPDTLYGRWGHYV